MAKIENGHVPPEEKKQTKAFSQLQEIRSNLGRFSSENSFPIDSSAERHVLSYVAVMIDPKLLQATALLYETSLNNAYSMAGAVLEDPDLRNIARAFINYHEREVAKTKEVTIVSPEATKRKFIALFKKSLRNPEEILTPNEMRYFQLYQEGKSVEEIAEILNVGVGNVYKRFFYMRQKFEKRRFIQNGITRVQTYGPHIQDSASHRYIGTGKLFGILYTNDENVALAEGRRRIIDESLLQQGYAPLSELVSKQEYQVFKENKQYQQYIKRSGNVVYVLIEALPIMKEMKRKKKCVDTPPAGHVPLHETYKSNYSLYRKLLTAISNRQLNATLVKIDSTMKYFVDPEEVDEYVQKYGGINN